MKIRYKGKYCYISKEYDIDHIITTECDTLNSQLVEASAKAKIEKTIFVL